MYNILVEVSYLIPMYTSIATPWNVGEDPSDVVGKAMVGAI